MTTTKFNKGDKVMYTDPSTGARQIGIVKLPTHEGFDFVVYNCGGEWENYMNYTVANTDRKHLTKGWQINQTWEDDLIWCPSQCYYKFIHKNKFYCIYLRWRGGDPWTAELYQCEDINFNITNLDAVSQWLYVEDCKQYEVDKIKMEALKHTVKYLEI